MLRYLDALWDPTQGNLTYREGSVRAVCGVHGLSRLGAVSTHGFRSQLPTILPQQATEGPGWRSRPAAVFLWLRRPGGVQTAEMHPSRLWRPDAKVDGAPWVLL